MQQKVASGFAIKSPGDLGYLVVQYGTVNKKQGSLRQPHWLRFHSEKMHSIDFGHQHLFCLRHGKASRSCYLQLEHRLPRSHHLCHQQGRPPPDLHLM